MNAEQNTEQIQALRKENKRLDEERKRLDSELIVAGVTGMTTKTGTPIDTITIGQEFYQSLLRDAASVKFLQKKYDKLNEDYERTFKKAEILAQRVTYLEQVTDDIKNNMTLLSSLYQEH